MIKNIIFIISFFLISLFFDTFDVLAISTTYSSSTFSVNDLNCNVSGENCIFIWSDYYNLSTIHKQPVGTYKSHQMVLRVYGGTTTYSANNTYVFQFKISQGTKKYLDLAKTSTIKVSYNSTSSNTNQIKLDSTMYATSFQNDTTSSYDWFVTFTVVPPVNSKYFEFVIQFGELDTRRACVGCNSDYIDIRTTGLSIDYSEGTNAFIQKQTALIQQKFEELFNIFKIAINSSEKNSDDMLNSDSDSSFNGNTGSVDDYHNSKDDLTNGVDVDVSDLNFDSTNYSNTFNWTWENITNFLMSNLKVFGLYTTALTLSFVALVVGRR